MYLTLTCTNNVFCFQETALEVFLSDGHNHFLVFPKSVRNKVYDKWVDEFLILTAAKAGTVVRAPVSQMGGQDSFIS